MFIFYRFLCNIYFNSSNPHTSHGCCGDCMMQKELPLHSHGKENMSVTKVAQSPAGMQRHQDH